MIDLARLQVVVLALAFIGCHAGAGVTSPPSAAAAHASEPQTAAARAHGARQTREDHETHGPRESREMARTNVLYQFAPFASLVRGRYDGELRVDELLRHGDFGLGAPDGLDGELVVLDGRAAQVRSDGSVHAYDAERTTPAACVTFFRPTLTRRIERLGEPLDEKAFEARLDALAPAKNRFIALRITGTFETVRTRSAPPPPKPYPDLAHALEHQAEFELRETKGTLVGFRMPSFASGFNFPGYHFHFLTNDRSAGGHVLDYEVRHATVEIAVMSDVMLELPRAADFDAADISLSPSTDTTRIERGGSR